MNEQAIVDSYNEFVKEGYTKSLGEFKNLIATNPNALQDSYNVFVSQGYTKSIDDYKLLMGITSNGGEVKKKETTQSGVSTKAQRTIATENFVAPARSQAGTTASALEGTSSVSPFEQKIVPINTRIDVTEGISGPITKTPYYSSTARKLKDIEAKKESIDNLAKDEIIKKEYIQVGTDNARLQGGDFIFNQDAFENYKEQYKKSEQEKLNNPLLNFLDKTGEAIGGAISTVLETGAGLLGGEKVVPKQVQDQINIITPIIKEKNKIDREYNSLQSAIKGNDKALEWQRNNNKNIVDATLDQLMPPKREHEFVSESTKFREFKEDSADALNTVYGRINYIYNENEDKFNLLNKLQEQINSTQDEATKNSLVNEYNNIVNDPSVKEFFDLKNKAKLFTNQIASKIQTDFTSATKDIEENKSKPIFNKIVEQTGGNLAAGLLSLPYRAYSAATGKEEFKGFYDMSQGITDYLDQNSKFSDKYNTPNFYNETEYKGKKILVDDNGVAYSVRDNNLNEVEDTENILSEWNNLKNKTKVDSKFNPYSSLANTTQVVADMIPLIVAGEITGAEEAIGTIAGKTATKALAKKYAAGLITTIAQTQNSIYDQVKDNPNMTEQQKNAYAMSVSTGIGLLNMGFGGYEPRLMGITTAAEKQTLAKVINNNIARMAAGDITTKEIVTEFAKATGRNILKEVPEELTEELLLEPLTQNAITAITNAATGADIDYQDISLDSIKDQALPIILSTSFMGTLGSYKGKNRLQQDAIYSASQDFEKFKDVTTQLVMNKSIDPSIANTTLNTVEKISNTINSVPNLTEEQKYNVSSLMLDNDKVQVELNKNISDVLKDKYKSRIAENNAVIAKILGNESLTPEEVTANGLVEPPAAIQFTATQPEVTFDIEAKKNDIEKRRQEELGTYNEEQLNEAYTVGSKETIGDKINAKYDAELKALEESKPVQTTAAVTVEQAPVTQTIESTTDALVGKDISTIPMTLVGTTVTEGEQPKTTEQAISEAYNEAINMPEQERTADHNELIDAVNEVIGVKEDVESEADRLEAMFEEDETPEGETRFRLAEEGGEPTEMDIEDIVAQMNDMPQAEIDFTEPEVSQKELKVNPVQESNSVIKIAKKISDVLLKPIQYFNGIPMIMGMSDMLAAGKIKDSTGKNMDVEGGLLFNVLGKNKNAAWAGVTEEGANKQYNDALNLYKNNKELFDRLWKEGRLPDGHIPMAILRMADTAINSNEAVFRWILPTVESFSAKNKKNAMDSFMQSMNEKLNTESSSKAQKIIDFVKEKKITSLDQFFRQIISDANLRAKGSDKAKLNLDDRSLIYDSIFAPSGIKTASKPTIKALLEGTDNSKNNLFTSDVIYKAIGEPSMLKTKQGEVVSVVGIDVKNGGVVPVEHGNYGFGPKGKTIALIENPKHGTDVFAEWKAKASRIFKKNKKGEFPTAKNVATQTGGAFFTDKAFISAKVSEGAISDLNLLIGKLRFAFPSVSVSTTQEEFDNIINSPDVRKSVSNGKIILGLTKDGKIYLNPSIESLKTPIHEFGHIWIDFLRSEASGKKGTELLNQGLKLVKNTEAHKKAIKKYGNNEIALEEALVELMANKGSTIINAATKSKFKSWMNAVFKYIQSKFTTFKDLDASRISEMKLDEFINTGLADLFSGSEVSSKFKPNLSEAAIKARMSIESKIDNIVSRARAQGFSEEGIKEFLKRKGLTDEDIATAMGKVTKAATKTELSEDTLTGYDKIMAVVQKGIAKGTSLKNIIAAVQITKIYANATDVQREMLVRKINEMYGSKEKAAPSVTKLFPELKNANKITMTEKDLLKQQLKNLARGAKDAKAAWTQASSELAKYVKELKDSGKITVNQVANVISKFSKVNMFNENSVNNFVDYMANVFADAEYNNKISLAASKLKTVRNNIGTKLGISKELVPMLNRLFSVNPKIIPIDMLDKYMALAEMLGERKAVLTLEEKNSVIDTTKEILEAINNEQEQAEILADKYDMFTDKELDKDGNVLFADTLDKMVKQDIITEKEADIIRKYKSKMFPADRKLSSDAAKQMVDRLVNEGLSVATAIKKVADSYGISETEVNDLLKEYEKENKDLINLVVSTDVNSDNLPSRDERGLAKRLKKLASSNALKGLTNQELRNLLKVMDNINNGYISHYAQVLVEKMNAFDRSTVVERAIKRAALLPISKVYAMAKKVIFNDSTALTMIKRNPLYYVDQVFGDFKTKDIFDSIFKEGAQALSKLHTDLKTVDNMLERATAKVSKSHGNEPNEVTNSIYKMGVYLRQLEYESNKGSKQVNPAADYIRATIKHINSGESQYNEGDVEMLNKILKDYNDGEDQIDLNKLYNSFNPAEKAAIKTIQDINESMVDKAMYTASIINGKKIDPLANYSHVMVLNTSLGPNAIDLASEADNAMNLMPSTKAKSLEERSRTAKPINFDPFASTHRSAKMVLTNYHLTEPVRTARRTLSNTKTKLEQSGDMTKKDRDIANALNSVYNDTIKHILSTSYQEDTFFDTVSKYITTQAYRTVLAGAGRFASELASNIGFAVPIIVNNPSIMKAASKFSSVIMGTKGASIMNNLKSIQTSRIYPTDTLSSSAIDTSALSKTHGKIGGGAMGDVNNKVQQVYNNTLKKYKNSVEFIADTLVSTPDKAIIRPIWFGTFASEFKKITGEDPDFEKIASNDEQYMNEHAKHLEEATDKADQMSVFTGATENAFMDIAKGKSLPNQGTIIKAFNTINGFMQKFMIYEYITARTALMASIGKGNISKKEGAAMLGGVVTRIIMYSMLSKTMSSLIAKAFGGGDDDEEDEKTFLQSLGQGGASALSSLLLGRDFGAITKMFISFGVEKVNENYLDFLRNGDYDPFKDNIERSAIPTDLTKDSGFDNFLINISGPLSPLLKTTKLVWKNVYGPEKKEQAAIERQKNERMYRIPLEILGNAGLIPIYKDVRNVVNSVLYKNLKENSKKLKSSDDDFKSTLKKTDPETYKVMYGDIDKIESEQEKLINDMEKEIKRLEDEMKY